MEQVSMRAMEFDDLESGFQCSPSRIAESVDGGANLHLRKFLRDLVALSKCDCARPVDGRPSALFRTDRLCTFPRSGGASLASGMRQLGAGDGTLFLDEPRDPRQKFYVLVFPYSQIFGTDASFRNDRIRLRKNHCCTAHRSTAEVDEMPIVGEAIVAR